MSDYSFTLADVEAEVSNALIEGNEVEGNTVFVQNAHDSGDRSLRKAIEYATTHTNITNITFSNDLSFSGAEIKLERPLVINVPQNLIIEGYGVKLSAANDSVSNFVEVQGGNVQLRNFDMRGATGSAIHVTGGELRVANTLLADGNVGITIDMANPVDRGDPNHWNYENIADVYLANVTIRAGRRDERRYGEPAEFGLLGR